MNVYILKEHLTKNQYSIKETAYFLEKSYTAIWRMIQNKVIKAEMQDGHYVINRKEILNFCETKNKCDYVYHISLHSKNKATTKSLYIEMYDYLENTLSSKYDIHDFSLHLTKKVQQNIKDTDENT